MKHTQPQTWNKQIDKLIEELGGWQKMLPLTGELKIGFYIVPTGIGDEKRYNIIDLTASGSDHISVMKNILRQL
jgi:hypothetical protein